MPRSTDIRSGSARLAYDDEGDGPAVVLLHPGVADRRCWEACAAALAGSYRVIRYDRRGFGATAYEPEPHDPAADLLALLDALAVDRVAVVGNSQGGRVGIDVTLAAPDRVAALVLVAEAVRGAPTPDLTPEELEISDRSDEVEAAGDLDAVNRFEAHIWLDGPFREEGTVGDPARALFLDMNGRALAAPDPGPWVEPDGPSAWDRLGEIAVPVLSLVGRHDFPYQIARSRAVATRIPGARHVELPDSAHLPQLDDPGRFTAAVADFLAGSHPASSSGIGRL